MELLKLDSAEVLAYYDHYNWNGYAAVTRNHFAEGYAYYIGCMMDQELLKRILMKALEDAGIKNIVKEEFPVIVRKGINDFGKTSLEGYLDRCIIAYKEFFNPAGHVSRNMYPFSLGIFYKVLLGIGIFMTIYLIFRRTQKSITYGIQLLLLVLFLPLAVNFIYVMCEQATVHTLMMYGEVFFFVYFIWVLEQLKFPNEKISQVVTKGMAIILLVVTAMYCRFDNICYLKAEILQSQAISYYTTLITRIKSTEGYTDDMPVVYINENKKQI